MNLHDSDSPFFETRCAITGEPVFGEAWVSDDGKTLLSTRGYAVRGNYFDHKVAFTKVGTAVPSAQEFVSRWQRLVLDLMPYVSVAAGLDERRDQVDAVVASLGADALGDEKIFVPFRQFVGSGVHDLSAKIAATLVRAERIAASEALARLVSRMWTTWAGCSHEFQSTLDAWTDTKVRSLGDGTDGGEQSFGHKLQIMGHNVMEDWEVDYMKRSVDFLVDACPARPIRVLEAGWGQGISGRRFLENDAVSYEVIELHPAVADNAKHVLTELRTGGVVREGAMEKLAPGLEERSYDIVYYDIYTPTHLSESVDALRDKNAFVAHYVSQLQATPRSHDFYGERLDRAVTERVVDGPEHYTSVPDFVLFSLVYPLLDVGGVLGFYSSVDYVEDEPLRANYRRTLFPEQRTLRVEGNQPTPATYYDAGTHMYAYCFRKC